MSLYLKTDRLILIPVNLSHLPIYQEILGTDELTKYLPKRQAYTVDEIQQHAENRASHWQKHGYGSYIIVSKDNVGRAIGFVGVEVCPNVQFSDIRYAMLPEGQGQGYVFEASQQVLQTTFEHFAKQGWQDKPIYGVCLPDNHASVYLLQKLGMKTDECRPYDSDSDELIVMSLHPKKRQ